MQFSNSCKLNTTDITYNLARYDKLCLIEFINFGTQNTSNIFKIACVGQEIILIEKYLSIAMSDYVAMVSNDINNPNIYYIQQILISMLNLINHLTSLYFLNEKNIESCANKQKYIIGFIANIVNKFLCDFKTDNLLSDILNKSNVFSFNSFGNLKTFIKSFRNYFASPEICNKIENIVTILET
jgi:hypothetical protein